MSEGTYALCLQKAELQDSHLLAKGFYEMLRSPGDDNENPVLVTGDVQHV